MDLLKTTQRMHIKILSAIMIFILILLSWSLLFTKPSFAYGEQPFITGQWVYIKNAYSGRYLDVASGDIDFGPPYYRKIG